MNDAIEMRHELLKIYLEKHGAGGTVGLAHLEEFIKLIMAALPLVQNLDK